MKQEMTCWQWHQLDHIHKILLARSNGTDTSFHRT